MNVAEVNQRRWSEESGQWLVYLNQNPFLASGKPVRHKRGLSDWIKQRTESDQMRADPNSTKKCANLYDFGLETNYLTCF